MNDNLKDFIDANRLDFEIYKSDFDAIWGNIDKGLHQRKKPGRVHFKPLIKVAASLAILLTVSIAFFMGKRSAEIEKNGIALHNISPELAETEAYYSGLIQDQMSFINSNKVEISADIWASLDQLDKDYNQLKNDLKDRADSEEVINAMIEYYRLKLEMLRQISEEIKENKDEDEEFNI